MKTSGADYKIVEIDLKNKPEWYQPKINPASKVCIFQIPLFSVTHEICQVPALWYDAPKDADSTAPPPGTFILPESALIVDFMASVYPELQCTFFPALPIPSRLTSKFPVKDPITRAKGALMALQYEAVSKAWFAYSVLSDGGSGKELDDFLNAVREFTPFIPDEIVKSDEYGVADIMVAPFLVSFTSAGAYVSAQSPDRFAFIVDANL
jgi:glutathione S-transferase